MSVGAQIRALRQRRDWSLNDLAEASGFSKGFLSKIENGLAQPPIATLMAIAEALDVGIGALFDDPPAADGDIAVLTRRSERRRETSDGTRNYDFERLAVGSPFQLTPYLIHLAEDGLPPSTSLQHAGEEVIHVLRGTLEYRVGPQIHRLRRGDTLVFDASLPHGPIKLPGKTASFIAVFAGGRRS